MITKGCIQMIFLKNILLGGKKLNIEHNIPISNHPFYYEKLYTNFNDDTFLLSNLLHRYNKKAFTKLFGKHQDTFDYEGISYIWEREYKGYKFYLFANNVKGTTYEIRYEKELKNFMKDNYVGDIIVEFINNLKDELLSITDVKKEYEKLKTEIKKWSKHVR